MRVKRFSTAASSSRRSASFSMARSFPPSSSSFAANFRRSSQAGSASRTPVGRHSQLRPAGRRVGQQKFARAAAPPQGRPCRARPSPTSRARHRGHAARRNRQDGICRVRPSPSDNRSPPRASSREQRAPGLRNDNIRPAHTGRPAPRSLPRSACGRTKSIRTGPAIRQRPESVKNVSKSASLS